MTRFSTTCLVPLLAVLATALPLAAAGLETRSQIDTVTIYADRAEVTRIVDFASEAGRHELVVQALPETVLPDSLVVVPGNAGAAVVIGRVALVQQPRSEVVGDEVRRLRGEIERLEGEVRISRDRIESERVKIDVVKRIGALTAERVDAQLGVEPLDPAVWAAQLDSLGRGVDAGLAVIRDAEEHVRITGREIDRLRRELELASTGSKTVLAALVDIDAETATEGSFRLSYQVRDAYWQAAYEARLDSVAGRLALAQQASVRQKTGEDWRDVVLRLSTAAPSHGGLPQLEPWVIDVVDPALPMAMAPMAEESLVRSMRGAADVALAQKATRAESVVQTQGFSTMLVVDGRVDVASDEREHVLPVQAVEQAAVVSIRAIPRLEQRAYVSTSLDFEGDIAWPAGNLRLYRDGGYVGETALDTLMPGSQRRLEFGHDDLIEVDYRLDRSDRSSEGIITDYRRTERRFVMTLANRHGQAMRVTVLDQLPVAADERISVERLD